MRHEVERLGDARLQLLQRALAVLVLGNVDAGEARHRALRRVAGDLDLAREGKHIGEQAIARDHQRIDLARVAVRLRLVEDRRKIAQRVGKARRGSLIHRDSHRRDSKG
jgi:hypothetical protein